MRDVLLGPFGLRPKMTMARRALPLARALAARGHAVRVVLPPWDCPQDSGRTWQEGAVQVLNVRLPPRLPLLGHLWLTARLLRAALRFRPHVIHCFKPKAYAGLAAAALWAMQRLHLWPGRLIVDADDWEGWGGWNEIAGTSWAQRHFFAWQEQWGLRHCDAVTVASRWLEQRVTEMRGGSGDVWVVPNGVEQRSRGAGERGGRGAVLLYTRFVEFTPERAVDIWRRVVEFLSRGAEGQRGRGAEEQRSRGARENAPQHPSTSAPLHPCTSARLWVVGEGLRGEEESLPRLLAEAGLDDTVDIIGWVEPEDLPPLFAAADVAMMPVDDTILNRAKCPARLLDLLAAGVPVVAEAVGEVAEIVEDGVSGLLVDPGQEAAFAAAVVSLLQDADLRRRMGEAAQRRVRTAFAWDRLAETVEAAYLQCPISNTQYPISTLQNWLPPLLWMGLIFLLSSQSKLPIPRRPLADQLWQIGGHVVLFGVLWALLWRAMTRTWSQRRVMGWAFLVGLLYAVSDEVHQAFVPGRHATPLDVAADVVGLLLAMGLIAWRQRRQKKKPVFSKKTGF